MKDCKANSTADSCKQCMEGAPYEYCCSSECREHEFCRECKFRSKYVPMIQDDHVIVTIPTQTKSNKPNVNGVIYSDKVFNDCICEMDHIIKEGGIKLAFGLPLDKDVVLANTEYEIGTVIDVQDGNITVSFTKDKYEKYKSLADKGYKPGMRYMADVDKYEVIRISSIICYEMICLPTGNEED